MNDTETSIRFKLTKALNPEILEITNDSSKHHGHAGSPGTGDSHFTLLVVSSNFDGLSLVERQQKVYSILSDEMSGPIHALSMKTVTPAEHKG
ncbi:MAG: BolA family transcriptional regulator [Candidatus Lindowbacteria bacterium]|nr:BolA family transcriptional regulator [Candidatus Lindowbacteria bacterium]